MSRQILGLDRLVENGIRADFPMGLRVRCTLTKRRRPKYEKLPDRHFPRKRQLEYAERTARKASEQTR